MNDGWLYDGAFGTGDFRYDHPEEYDLYEYVMGVNNMKEYLNRRQRSNVGMGNSFPLSRPTDIF